MDRKRLVVSLRRHVATIGLLFAAAQGWGAALLIYPVMGIALASLAGIGRSPLVGGRLFKLHISCIFNGTKHAIPLAVSPVPQHTR